MCQSGRNHICAMKCNSLLGHVVQCALGYTEIKVQISFLLLLSVLILVKLFEAFELKLAHL